MKLIDKHNRHITKLRLSLLDSCNMNCFYCMPENKKFMNKDKWLSPAEIYEICDNLTQLGIEEIRLTGGEPTLREDFIEIVDEISKLEINKLAVTSNGLALKKHLQPLTKTKLRHINISLDSLDKNKFRSITKNSQFEEVLESILYAKELGFNVKINTVLLKGINDNEIEDFINFSKQHAIPVRFLEIMKIGEMINFYDQHFLSAQLIVDYLNHNHSYQKLNDSKDSTSTNYQLENGAEIGIIAPVTNAFCGQCSRLRMGPNGVVYPCLFIDSGINIRGKNISETTILLKDVINLKPIERISQISKPMHAIGG